MYCRHCGNEVKDGQKFCAKCGNPLGGSIAATGSGESCPHKPEEVAQKSKRWRIVGIVSALIVVLVAVGAFAAMNLGAPSTPEGLSPSRASFEHYYSDELFYAEPDESHIAEDPDTGIDYINNEVILYCEEGTSANQVLKSVGEADFELVGHIEAVRSYQVRLAQEKSYGEINMLCQRISQTEGVADCLPHYVMAAEPTDITRDSAWSEAADEGKPSKTWGLRSIKAPEAWNLVEADESVRVGVMEASQFYVYHEDLDSAIKSTFPSSDSQFDIKDEDPDKKSNKNKPDTHGTHVAGIIGAESNETGSVGVAYGVSLHGYLCGGKDSSGNPKMTANYGIEVGLGYLIVMLDCDVVNISVQWNWDDDNLQRRASESSGDDAAAAKWEMQQYGLALETYFKALINGGHDDFLICKSADNDGDKGLANWDVFGCIQDSEVASRILVVGSLTQVDNDTLEVSARSNTGYWDSSCGSRVDVLAPGHEIYSTVYNVTDEGDASIPYSDYGYMSGTSMATPMVSGVAALVKSANPELKGDQIKEIICATATGSYGDKTGVSRGQVDAEAAVKKAIDMKPLVVYLNGETADERYSAYLKKVEECQSAFGEGKIVDAGTSTNTRCSKGLCLADLIDFDGDGDEELLLGYYDESQSNYHGNNNATDSRAYRAEIWGYETGGIRKLFESGLHSTNGGFAYLPVYHRSHNVAMYTIEYDTAADNRAVGTNGIWILNDDSFDEITSFSIYGMWGTGTVEYEIDGEKVDESIYRTHFNDVMGDHTSTSYWMTWNDGSSSHEAERWDTLNDVDETLKITRDTIKKLRGTDTASEGTAEAWAQFPQSFVFTSGAGAWSTQLDVAANGTFTGYFHDSDMGGKGNGYPNGTRYETHFAGEFTAPVKVDDYEYTMQLKRLEITDEAGERIEDGVRIVPVTDSVYGLGDETNTPTGTYSLHLPGQATSNLSDSAKSWLFIQGSKMQTINFYAIVNSSDSKGDLAFKTVEEFGEAEMAADDDENVLRSYVEANAGHDILYWFYGDFDNDGTYEAMAIAGVANNARNYEGEWIDGEIWYVGKDGGRQAGWPESGNALNGIIKDGKTGYSFLSIERDGHGSGSSSEVYVAKSDGCSVALFDVGTVGNFHEDGGRLIGYTQTMENGYHQYAWHEFEFHPENATFTSKGVFDMTSSRKY